MPETTPPSPRPPGPPASEPSAAPLSAAERRGRWVAIVTGALSVLVGVLYLLMIVLLDSRGPLQPPPPEALGLVSGPALAAAADRPGAGAVPVPSAAEAPPPG